MTREELKKVFGDSLKELKPIIIRPEKVNTAKFSGFAVFMPEDCSEILSVKALIGEPETVKCHGVIPQKPPADGALRFNCIVGDYEESRCPVTIDVDGQPKNRWTAVAGIFGARYVYASKPGIYRTSVSEDSVGKLIERQNGDHIGFFRTAESVKAEINRVSSEYRNGLLVKIDNIVDGDMLDARYNKIASLKETAE